MDMEWIDEHQEIDGRRFQATAEFKSGHISTALAHKQEEMGKK